MQAWGIIMTVFTLFGMLVLTIASVTMDTGFSESTREEAAGSVEPAQEAPEFKKAA